MKSKKVFSKIVVFMLLASTFLFAACTLTATPEFVIKATAAETAQTTVDWLIDNAYENDVIGGEEEGYSYAGAIEEAALEDAPDYYIEVGTMKNIDAVNSISIGGLKYEKDDEFYFVLGNDKIILDKAFKKVGNKLFIAAPIVAFESVNSDKIKINNFTFNFKLNTAAEAFSFESVTNIFGNAAYLSTDPEQDYDYSLIICDGTPFNLTYEGITQDEVVFTRNVLGEDLKSYGVVKAYNNDGLQIDYCPFDWERANFISDINSHKFEMDDYTNGRLVYKAYIPAKGIATLTFKIIPGE